jgi:hypothetical protein
MAFEPKDMSGAIFENDRRQSDRQPNMTGTCLIDGKPYRVSAWWKQSSRGEFLSLAFSVPQPQQQQGESQAPRRTPATAPTRQSAAQGQQQSEFYDEPSETAKDSDIPF